MMCLKSCFKDLISKIVSAYFFLFGGNAASRFMVNEVIFHALNKYRTISHGLIELKLTIPNPQIYYRVDSFSTKEPETLDWIDQFNFGDIFWDIGANVGLYSCYAAKSKSCRVFSFEPSVFNTEFLARNIHLNNLQNFITIMPFAVSDKTGVNSLNMTTTTWGGAMSTFGKGYGHDGKELDVKFNYMLPSFPLDDVVEYTGIPKPKHIKIDVDGIEHLILSGGIKVLGQIESLLVEVNDSFFEQEMSVKNLLKSVGMKMVKKEHAPIFDLANNSAKTTYNQIWIRS